MGVKLIYFCLLQRGRVGDRHVESGSQEAVPVRPERARAGDRASVRAGLLRAGAAAAPRPRQAPLRPHVASKSLYHTPHYPSAPAPLTIPCFLPLFLATPTC